MGMPSGYTEELAGIICAEIAEGRSLRSICKDEGMPSKSMVFRWLAAHEDFRMNYAIAKEECAELYAEEIIEIADDGRNDWMETHDDAGNQTGWRLNGEHVQRSRLRVDSRKWIAAKLKPKKYGDYNTTRHVGDPDEPVITKWEYTVVDP